MNANTPDRPRALMPLISICLSELRADVDQLSGSRWARVPLARARELIGILEDACVRQRLDGLAAVFRSMRNLLNVSREEALPMLPELRTKLAELLRSAERLVTTDLRRERA
jgi:hypothetical protein